MDVLKLADSIIYGSRLKREDNLSFFKNADLSELCKGADRIRSALCGNHAELCSIINGRSGKCSEDCKFCSQSAHHCTESDSYDFLDESKMFDVCKYNESKNIRRFSVVTSGRTLDESDFEKALSVYRRMKNESKIKLCASHGLLDNEQFKKLHEAGVSRYHCNIETSRRFFPQICTTHTYDEKINCIKLAKNNGFSVCSGGIIGMGETWADRIDMAVSLSEMKVDSIPINFLIRIKGTPLENAPPLSCDDILRTVAMFRYINPDVKIRLAGGRSLMSDSGKQAFLSGANSAISGDMLTTSGSSIDSDTEMLKSIGFVI